MIIWDFPCSIEHSIIILLSRMWFSSKGFFPLTTLSVYDDHLRINAKQPDRLVVIPLPHIFFCFLSVSFKTSRVRYRTLALCLWVVSRIGYVDIFFEDGCLLCPCVRQLYILTDPLWGLCAFVGIGGNGIGGRPSMPTGKRGNLVVSYIYLKL